MGTKTTKDIEAAAFDEFCKISNLLATEDFIHDDKPEFQHVCRSLGVELISYHRDADRSGRKGSSRRRWESQLEHLLDQVRSDYDARHTERIEVYVHPRRASQVVFSETVRADLLTLIVARAAGVDQPIPPSLLPMIEDVSASPVPWWSKSCPWQMVLADFVDVEVDAVQACLNEKESKLDSYRQRCPEVWLLVHGSPGVYVGAPDYGRWSTCGHIRARPGTCDH